MKITRRSVLRGAGATLGLPMLEAMVRGAPAAEAAALTSPPKRLAFVYIPNGVILESWTPTEVGADYTLPPTLEPLAAVKSQLTVLSQLDRTFAGGTGVHAQCGACWLSSSPPDRARDGGFPTDVSVDQIAARHLSQQPTATDPTGTLLPSLELSCNNHTNSKETKYFESISWYGPGYAANVEKNPRAVFRRLFRVGETARTTRSVLDVVLADARAVRGELGVEDRGKFDEYLHSVREVESRIQRAERHAKTQRQPPMPEPAGIPDDRGQYIRLMGELIVLAFALDLTRVATLVIDPERWDTPRTYHGVFDKPQNHHVLTHTKGDDACETLRKIDRFHVSAFADIAGRMASVREGDGNLLDSSAFVLGSGLGDGRVHSYKNLPVVVAGSLGGRLNTGRHICCDKGTPLANLWLSLLDAVGVRQDRFADSTGRLSAVLKNA